MSCGNQLANKELISLESKDNLPSWSNGSTKQDIIQFVDDVTTSSASTFIPVVDRIAVFDNDGTLWAEQPMYFQLIFALERIKETQGEHPEWFTQEPYKWVLEDDVEKLKQMSINDILNIVMVTHAGMNQSEFEQDVKDWFAKAKHPTTSEPFSKMVYQPMLELLDYLRFHDFKIYIVSGGGVDFMRPVLSEVYNIPNEQIIGSTIKTKFHYEEGGNYIERLPELNFINDKEGKPENIQRIIGKVPVFCGGNSDGDLAMMRYTNSSQYKSMKLYVHHTDAEREWAYDSLSHIGRLKEGLLQAQDEKWTVVNMKNDWNEIFPL